MNNFGSYAIQSFSLHLGLDLIILTIMLIVLIVRAKVLSYVESVCDFFNKNMQSQKLCVKHTKCWH